MTTHHSTLSYEALKTRHRLERDQQHPNLSLRLHRALSWLQLAESKTDLDSRFIFLWIAFNAAYATDIDLTAGMNQQEVFGRFTQKLHTLDTHQHLNQLVWKAYPQSIRALLNNPYVFSGFWEYQKGQKTAQDWEDELKRSKNAANSALSRQDTPVVLSIVLNRIYVLRNQLIHGGATWNSQMNRQQVRDCTEFMAQLLPIMLLIMMDSPNTLWGDVNYPPIQA